MGSETGKLGSEPIMIGSGTTIDGQWSRIIGSETRMVGSGTTDDGK
jgi:hypothetical protein